MRTAKPVIYDTDPEYRTPPPKHPLLGYFIEGTAALVLLVSASMLGCIAVDHLHAKPHCSIERGLQ
jgi:hypothetical protein